MLSRPNKYDEIEVNEMDYTPIELGGHKCIIKKVEQYTSQISGKKSLKVEIDTDSTDKQPNYYQTQYDNNTNSDKKWPNGAVKYVSLGQEETQIRMLKAFITAVENSNSNFTFDWDKDESQLVGKKIGGVFGYEEYQANDGTVKKTTKCINFRSIDKIKDVAIPKVKLITGEYIDYEDYKNPTSMIAENNSKDSNEIIIGDDDLPF